MELTRFRDDDLVLGDGTCVRRGDLIGEVHLDNHRIRQVGAVGWQVEALRLAQADLRALARWAARQPPERRPVAYHAETLLGPFARWGKFEIRRPPDDAMHRLRAWYLRGILARWSPQGHRRLDRGRTRLPLRVIWLSHAALQREHGTD